MSDCDYLFAPDENQFAQAVTIRALISDKDENLAVISWRKDASGVLILQHFSITKH